MRRGTIAAAAVGAAAAAVARRRRRRRGERGERASGGGGGGDVGEVCCLICEEAPLQIRFSCGHATCCRGCLPAVMGHVGGSAHCRAPIDLGASVALKAGSRSGADLRRARPAAHGVAAPQRRACRARRPWRARCPGGAAAHRGGAGHRRQWARRARRAWRLNESDGLGICVVGLWGLGRAERCVRVCDRSHSVRVVPPAPTRHRLTHSELKRESCEVFVCLSRS